MQEHPETYAIVQDGGHTLNKQQTSSCGHPYIYVPKALKSPLADYSWNFWYMQLEFPVQCSIPHTHMFNIAACGHVMGIGEGFSSIPVSW